MKLFLSRSVHKVDKKGRVSVPSGFRAVLGDAISDGLALNIPLGGTKCVEASPFAKIDDRFEQLSRLNADLPEPSALYHQCLGSLAQAPIDNEGRIVLPPHLMDHSGITDSATFVGMGHTFQIWEADALAAHDIYTREVARNNIHLLTDPTAAPKPNGGDATGGGGA